MDPEETQPPYPRSAWWAWTALAMAAAHFFLPVFFVVLVQLVPGLEDVLVRMDWLVHSPAVLSVLFLGVSVYAARREQLTRGFPGAWVHPFAFTLGVLAVVAHGLGGAYAWRLDLLARSAWLAVAWIIVVGVLYGFQLRRTGDYIVTMVNVLLAWLVGSVLWIVAFTLLMIIAGG